MGAVFDQFQSNFDPEHGGFGSAPKFPPAVQLALLMRISKRFKNDRAWQIVEHTLDCMAAGGIYDHLGGGFHRYSVDEMWLVPHFEKMLYDNALLVSTYLEAFQFKADPKYAEVAKESLNYVLREMTDAQGGFYSAQDAGAVGKEGEFYVWEDADLRASLTNDEYSDLSKIFTISVEGNFEHYKNILSLRTLDVWSERSKPAILEVRNKLLQKRNYRERPLRDDKILCAWNGLMLAAFAKGYQVLRDKRYLEAAQRCANFVRSNLFKGGELKRSYCDGEVKYRGYLEDYAYLIEGLLNLYEADFDQQWLGWARQLQDIQNQKFWDESEGGFWFSNEPEVIVRKKDYMDNATPSANGVSLLNLHRLNAYYAHDDLRLKAEKLLDILTPYIQKYPSAFSKTLIAYEFASNSPREIVFVTPNIQSAELANVLEWLGKSFIPNKVVGVIAEQQPSEILLFKGRTLKDGMLTTYVCQNHQCSLPIVDPEDLKKSLI